MVNLHCRSSGVKVSAWNTYPRVSPVIYVKMIWLEVGVAEWLIVFGETPLKPHTVYVPICIFRTCDLD